MLKTFPTQTTPSQTHGHVDICCYVSCDTPWYCRAKADQMIDKAKGKQDRDR